MRQALKKPPGQLGGFFFLGGKKLPPRSVFLYLSKVTSLKSESLSNKNSIGFY
jgi:hypothetical protein